MTLTVATLHRQLGELVKRGHGRKHVCIDKGTFNLDGALILGVESISGVLFVKTADEGEQS